MRAIGLAIVALGLFAPSASAATIEIEDVFCGCDGSSGDEDTHTIIVRAAPGELNRISVHKESGDVVVEDHGAPLTGACEPASPGRRICRDNYTGIVLELDDGDDELNLQDLGGSVDAGPGDDDIVVAGPPSQLKGGPGADLLDARLAPGSGISYRDHTAGVTVRLNELADDGSAGEGDNVLGSLGSIEGGAGHDTLVGGPEAESLMGLDGDDDISAGGGNDSLVGGKGADRLSGGSGRDELTYLGTLPLHLSIGDGPGDGAAGEGDDILGDIEDLIGGYGADVIIGDAHANRLVGMGGGDRIFGREGADRLEGSNAGDRLDAGPGPDRVKAGATDLALLDDGERDRTDCGSSAPVIRADSLDTFKRCAPWVVVTRHRRPRSSRSVQVAVRCQAPAAVPCRGHFKIRMYRGRVISSTVRFGPIRPGRRVVVTVPLRRRVTWDMVLMASGVSVRHDNVRSVTRLNSGF